LPVVSAPDEIDAANVDELRQVLLSCIDGKRTTLVVDMSRTTFCDSAGARQLLLAHKRVATGGGELRLVTGAASLRLIFEITGLDRLLPVFASLDAALAAAPAHGAHTRNVNAASR
jgi:anti-sigma B factor antagonist